MNIRRIITTKVVPQTIVLLLFCTGLFMRCAVVGAPEGGPKDTLPPFATAMTPHNGTVNFKDKRIIIEFNEYLKLKDLQKEFFVSPNTGKKPLVSIRGKGIQIDIKDTLRDNTTYVLNFGSSITDNNEGNPLNGFKYVLSTGPNIDSMVMSGYTVDAYTRDSVSKTFIYFYDATLDSIPEYDSLLFNVKPTAIARAEANGIFLAEYLKPIPYRIYAIKDNNDNMMYEPGVDKVAFLDSTYNPADMPSFSAWFDTTRMYMYAEPQLYFRLFTDKPFQRQLLSEAVRPLQHKAVLNFSGNRPQIDSIVLDGIDPAHIITEYMTEGRDTIALWLNVPADQLPDTIKGTITYMKHDSIRRLVRTTDKLTLGWKAFESKEQIKKREKQEKERAAAEAEGREYTPEPEPNPFTYKAESGNEVNPERGYAYSFDYPLVRIDSASITLSMVPEGIDPKSEAGVPVAFTMRRDTAQLRRWVINTEWQEGGTYKLMIPAGALVDVAGQSNDTIRAEITPYTAERFATVIAHVKGKSPESRYILQLLTADGKVMQEVRNASTGDYTFRYVPAGEVKMRAVEDVNANGKWDSGNLVERFQPERAEMYTDIKGESKIPTKENWDVDINLDMDKIFAPITMENIVNQLAKTEATRLEKIRRAMAEEAARQAASESNRRRRRSSYNGPAQ